MLTPSGLAPVRCPLRDACLAGGGCADGHGGPLCGVCREGWYLSGGACQQCDEGKAPAVVLYVVASLAAVALAFAYLCVVVVAERASVRASAMGTGVSSLVQQRCGVLRTMLQRLGRRALFRLHAPLCWHRQQRQQRQQRECDRCGG